MTLAEAVSLLRVADASLEAIALTAPKWVETFGGRDALVRRSEVTCVGPVPRLDTAEWEAMAGEYAARHWHSQSLREA